MDREIWEKLGRLQQTQNCLRDRSKKDKNGGRRGGGSFCGCRLGLSFSLSCSLSLFLSFSYSLLLSLSLSCSLSLLLSLLLSLTLSLTLSHTLSDSHSLSLLLSLSLFYSPLDGKTESQHMKGSARTTRAPICDFKTQLQQTASRATFAVARRTGLCDVCRNNIAILEGFLSFAFLAAALAMRHSTCSASNPTLPYVFVGMHVTSLRYLFTSSACPFNPTSLRMCPAARHFTA